MTIYIIYTISKYEKFMHIDSILSIWETRELAQAAIYWHLQKDGNSSDKDYHITERILNTTIMK